MKHGIEVRNVMYNSRVLVVLITLLSHNGHRIVRGRYYVGCWGVRIHKIYKYFSMVKVLMLALFRRLWLFLFLLQFGISLKMTVIMSSSGKNSRKTPSGGRSDRLVRTPEHNSRTSLVIDYPLRSSHTRILRPESLGAAIRSIGQNSTLTLEDVEYSIREYGSSIRPTFLADCIWSFGYRRMDFLSNFGIIVRLIEGLYLQRKYTSHVQVAKTYVGLARMQALWSMPLLPTQTLSKLLDENIEHMQAHGVSNVLWSLGVMQASVDDLSLSTKLSLLRRLQGVSREFNDQGLSNTLWGLAKIETSWDTLPIFIKSALCSAICRVCSRMSGQAVANSLYSLGLLGVYREGLTDRMLLAIEISIRKSFERMSSKDIVQSVHGLSLMGFQWSQLTLKTRECISIAIFKQVNRWRDDPVAALRETALLMYSLQSMKVSWKELPASIRSGVLIVARSLCDFEKQFDERQQYAAYGASRKSRQKKDNVDMSSQPIAAEESHEVVMLSSAQSAATLLYSFAKMNADFNTFPEESKVSLLKCLEIFHSHFSEQSLAMVFYALGKLQIKWAGTSKRLREQLCSTLMTEDTLLRAFSLAQIIYGLGAMKANWHDFSPQLQRSLERALENGMDGANSQMLGMTVHGLAQLGVEYNTDLSTTLQRRLVSRFLEVLPVASSHDAAVCMRAFGSMSLPAVLLGDMTALSFTIRDMDSHSIVSTLQGLQDMQTLWPHLAEEMKTSIFAAIADNTEFFSSEEIARVLYALGELKAFYPTFYSKNQQLVQKLIRISMLSSGKNGVDVAMLLAGFSKMKVSWRDISEGERALLYVGIASISDSLDTLSLRTLLTSLSSIKCDDVKILERLTNRLDRLMSSMGTSDMYAVLKAMQVLDFIVRDVPAISGVLSELKERLFLSDVAISAASEDNAQVVNRQARRSQRDVSIVDKLQVLASSSHVKWSDLPATTLSSIIGDLLGILSTATRTSSTFHSVVSILNSMKEMHCRWDQVPDALTRAILTALDDLYADPSTKPKQLYGFQQTPTVLLSDLGCRWSQLSSSQATMLLEILLLGLQRGKYGADEVTDTLVRLGLDWSTLSAENKRGLISSIIRMYQFNPESIYSGGQLLDRVNATWDKIPTRPRNELSNCLGSPVLINRKFEKSVFDVFMLLGAKWKMLTNQGRECVLRHMRSLSPGEAELAIRALEIPSTVV